MNYKFLLVSLLGLQLSQAVIWHENNDPQDYIDGALDCVRAGYLLLEDSNATGSLVKIKGQYVFITAEHAVERKDIYCVSIPFHQCEDMSAYQIKATHTFVHPDRDLALLFLDFKSANVDPQTLHAFEGGRLEEFDFDKPAQFIGYGKKGYFNDRGRGRYVKDYGNCPALAQMYIKKPDYLSKKALLSGDFDRSLEQKEVLGNLWGTCRHGDSGGPLFQGNKIFANITSTLKNFNELNYEATTKEYHLSNWKAFARVDEWFVARQPLGADAPFWKRWYTHYATLPQDTKMPAYYRGSHFENLLRLTDSYLDKMPRIHTTFRNMVQYFLPEFSVRIQEFTLLDIDWLEKTIDDNLTE